MALSLVINPGSTSKKYAVYDERDSLLLQVHFESTGDGFGFSIVSATETTRQDVTATDYRCALSKVLQILYERGIAQRPTDIADAAVRVVAPGSYFLQHHKIDPEYVERLLGVIECASLHITPILEEIQQAMLELPDTELWGISDSAFHHTLPDMQTAISLPRVADHDRLRAYGYHGLSFSSVMRKLDAAETLSEKTVVCHVGGGISVGGFRSGKSAYTSMGFSPASGMVMGTRGGDVSADAILAYMMQQKLDPKQAFGVLHTNSGIQGLAGVSDLRLLLSRYTKGDTDAMLAVQILQSQIQQQIAAAYVTLGGMDTLVFTATAVVRNPELREIICNGLKSLGVVLDSEKNDGLIDKEGSISAPESTVQVQVIKNDETHEMLLAMRSCQ